MAHERPVICAAAHICIYSRCDGRGCSRITQEPSSDDAGHVEGFVCPADKACHLYLLQNFVTEKRYLGLSVVCSRMQSAAAHLELRQALQQLLVNRQQLRHHFLDTCVFQGRQARQRDRSEEHRHRLGRSKGGLSALDECQERRGVELGLCLAGDLRHLQFAAIV